MIAQLIQWKRDTMGKVKVLQFFVEIISHKTVVIIIELQGINLRSLLGYQVIQFYQLTELTM